MSGVSEAREIAQEGLRASATALQKLGDALITEGSPQRAVSSFAVVLFFVTAGTLLTLTTVLLIQASSPAQKASLESHRPGTTEAADALKRNAGGRYDFYSVRPGDTLARIAARYNTTVKALADLNQIANPNLINVGQILKIPNASAGP